MKFTIQTLLSLPNDGASAHLIIFNNNIRVLLDCGIPPTFDFSKYREKAQELKSVCLVLISHSSLSYSGAMCFLIDQLGLNPKIFYTTQPIMRCSPLNLHDMVLTLRCPTYNKKVFNRVYKIYEMINIIKPQQKKSVEVEGPSIPVDSSANPPNPKAPNDKSAMDEEGDTIISEVEKVIYFTSYTAGSCMDNIAWRLSFGIVNIVYLVEYNNYSLYHISGLDLQQIIQPTDILITDTCPYVDDQTMLKVNLYNHVKTSILQFYERNGLPASKPPTMTNQQNQKKLLIVCNPGELMVEIMAVAKKVLQQIQAPENREKIGVVHLSSRFLQLVKSQIDYFTPYFKDTLETIQQFYIHSKILPDHSKTLSARLNIATLSTLETILNDQLNRSVEIIHIGSPADARFQQVVREKGLENVSSFSLFLPDERLLHSSSKIEEEKAKENEIGQMQYEEQEPKSEKYNTTEMQGQSEFRDIEKSDQMEELDPENQFQNVQPLHGKYLSQIGFPHFVGKTREESHDYDEYGLRHQYMRFEERQTIDEYRRQQEEIGGRDGTGLQKKNATIEVMNIQFRIPEPDRYMLIDYSRLKYLPFFSNKTNFNSSLQIILTLKPANVILINTKTTIRSTDELVSRYKGMLRQQKSINLYQLAPKHICHIRIENQLISYKVNYIPIPPDRKLQKVKGIINYFSNGTLCIHLSCLDQKEHLDFRLDQLYKRIKGGEHQCSFTKKGIVVDGIRIYRQEKNIVLEGYYSEQFFKVRKLLYDFLQTQ